MGGATPPATPSTDASSSSSSARKDNTASGSLYNLLFATVPSEFEVEIAVAVLRVLLQRISSNVTVSNWLQPMLGSCDISFLQSQGYRICNAFQLLLTDVSFKRLVVSLCSDKAVWDAIANNEVVKKLRELPPSGNARSGAGYARIRGPNEETDLAASILSWIVDITKAKLSELMVKFLSLVNDLCKFLQIEKANAEKEDLDDKVRSSMLLSVVILLIVVVARAHGA